MEEKRGSTEGTVQGITGALIAQTLLQGIKLPKVLFYITLLKISQLLAKCDFCCIDF